MLGFLLARAGVEVIVLEKHCDFFRDFRGDTIHPSTLEVMAELGLLETFLERPHDEMRAVRVRINGEAYTAADFSHLSTRCKFIAFMPQWEFLDFLSGAAKRCSTFRLRMEAEVTDLILDGERVAGVRAKTPEGELEVRADLVVGADGRDSTVRTRAGLEVREIGVPVDALWTRIPKEPGVGEQTLGYFGAGKFMVLIDRNEYFQCGYVIPKGGFDAIKQRGLEAFRAGIVSLAPFLRDSVNALDDWEEVKLLTVKIDRLTRWHRPGLLCIGDSAHAMSPVGGVGINLAIQDAVAAANLLAARLRQGAAGDTELHPVQRRREWPTRMYQSMQAFLHWRLLRPAAPEQQRKALAVTVWVLRHVPFLPRITARVIGLGFRPEHVRTPEL
jgi:2-polyprenyl-6-methoxyphenol hydroxylase-like FAD-dependent oxidoreductase